MKKIHAHGKCFDSKDFERLVIGGQNDADTIRFVIPKKFGDELDYSQWQWAIHYENKEGQGDTVALNAKISEENADNLWIDWIPTQTATQVSGKLICQLYAIKVEGDNTKRFCFHTFAIYVDEWLDPELITQTQPSLIEQALEEMAKYNQDLQDGIQAAKDAAKSEENAAKSATAAASSASAAKTSETNAKNSETNAKTSENNTRKIYEDAVELKEEYDAKVTADTNAFNANYDAKLKSFNDNASSKTNTYNTNAQNKLNEYNSNHADKLTALNTLKTQTEEARDTAVSAKDAAVSAKTAAETAKGQAEDAKDAAVSAKTASESARDAAKSSQSAAASSASTASTKASEASSSASAAQSAKTAAESAKTAAEEAETACQKLVESVDAEGLGERMDSIEADMANKSDNGHKHTSADITDLQGKLDAKQNKITGGASTVVTDNLDPSRALVSDGSGKIAVSAVTSTELGYLDGVKSNVQTQLDGKSSTSHTHNKIDSRGPVSELTGTADASGLQMYEVYNNDYPVPYGNLIHLKGKNHVGEGELLIAWPGTDSEQAPVYVRSRRDTGTAGWSEWRQLAKTTDNVASATKLQTKRTITLNGAISGSAQFDGSANIIIEVTNERRHWPGEIFAFAGKSNKLPARTLVCNGGAVSRNTYKELFNVIGTTYGAGDGSTTFNLPNLYACKNDDGTTVNNGVFLRAAVNDSQVGQKEQDAIRDITGWAEGVRFGYSQVLKQAGALKIAKSSQSGAQYDNDDKNVRISIDANAGATTDNPMAGHAVGPDIHPYSIRVLYLIAY